ncbi:MAG: hypothetical protein SVR81_07870 [Chloroflexota bacterium]|nr:hypothetical protein [Chloroflexota bacterium]
MRIGSARTTKLPEITPRTSPVGESAVLFALGDALDPAVDHQVRALDRWLAERRRVPANFDIGPDHDLFAAQEANP